MPESAGKTARYQIIIDPKGNRYRFFCELSGMAVCTTKPVSAGTQTEGLQVAWENEGKRFFNRCHRCGKWISDVMYNADTMKCVDCTPWEDEPSFCLHCGARATENDNYCRNCGGKLLYEGGMSDA